MATKVHWNYFIALEKDLETASRYVELDAANMDVFSIEFARLLFAASSEVDVVSKAICALLNPTGKAATNMGEYKTQLAAGLPDLASMEIHIPRYELVLKPWASLAITDARINWWDSYNEVKHDRGNSFHKATLRNALDAMAALMCLAYYYYGLDVYTSVGAIIEPKLIEKLEPTSTLLRFEEWMYYSVVVTPQDKPIK